VGGDFFQVIPLKSGHTLVIVGDVSGKGLTSAMIVSMLVGMLCTVTGFTEEPAEILGELNRRLCGRTHGGFVTCATMRLEADGRMTLANAGHLPPYLNGMEIPYAGSLPLGVSSDSAYEQSSFVLGGGDRLFLLTDGIVEAQNQEGELLGFPRVESMLREGATAHALAETAQKLGQADDITVLCIERVTGVASRERLAAEALPAAS
jgi:serine phosphatase RsbU (regulator of sigma subunit)